MSHVLYPLSEWVGYGEGDDWFAANAADPESSKKKGSRCGEVVKGMNLSLLILFYGSNNMVKLSSCQVKWMKMKRDMQQFVKMVVRFKLWE